MADGQVVSSVGIIGLGYVGLPLAVAFAEDILDRVISYVRQQRSGAAVARS